MEGAHGIIFMIDASKKQDFDLVKLEIENLINNYYASKSSLALVFNKKDAIIEEGANLNSMLFTMNLSNRTLNENNISRSLISLQTGEGFEKCCRDLYEQMNQFVASKV